MDILQRLIAEVRAKQAQVDALRHKADVLEQEAQTDWAHIQRLAVELEERDAQAKASKLAADVFGVEHWG